MKIAHVIASLGMGGAETLVAQLAGHQARQGHDVTIVMLLDQRDVAVPEGVRVLALEPEVHTPAGALRILRRLASLLRSGRPDVVHAHMLHSNLLTRLLRPILGRAVLVNTVHAVRETDNRAYRLAYRILDRLADATVFVSRQAMEGYRAQRMVSIERSAVVHNGIDLARFLPRPGLRGEMRRRLGFGEDDLVLTTVGRLTPDKDYPNLLTAFERVASQEPRARLLVVGEGELGEALRADARALAHGGRICFAGMRHDVPDVLAASDAFVLASAYEGFGLVLAEAMACMVPVVSTDCGGTAEVVGDTGILVPPRDPAALAQALLDTVSMPGDVLQARLHRARRRVEELFSLDAMADGWQGVYRRHCDA